MQDTPCSTPDVLRIGGLRAGYGRLTALKGVDLRVGRGEAVFVVGPNGAGKSTLLKTVSGLIAPFGGAIEFNGRSSLGLAPESLCRSGLALIPEGRHIFKSLSVRENLRVGMMVRLDKAEAEADLDQVLNVFPILRERFGGAAGYLSGGEQQQLAIARAILQRPKLLMIDEPSLGLAPLVIDQVYASLRDLKSKGLTLLIVEQSTARISGLADRIYILRNGSVILETTAEQMASQEDVEAAYFGFTK